MARSTKRVETPSFEVFVSKSIGTVTLDTVGEKGAVEVAFELIGKQVSDSEEGGDFTFAVPSLTDPDWPALEINLSVETNIEELRQHAKSHYSTPESSFD